MPNMSIGWKQVLHLFIEAIQISGDIKELDHFLSGGAQVISQIAVYRKGSKAYRIRPPLKVHARHCNRAGQFVLSLPDQG
ncbi:hypothetical protein MEA186_31736 [Mesorhizobium amorphae CCNWGS0123]|uniref:Uncharacterized protein n=1 Tax=Mesorhizobium amorphae CCNWGS0123 TaxID=1082933 RepID=G6YK13_9HYPH|nr:hypothetical protein A6B35_31880 [Mesorhizobium amorphae CCNWGS0123]EHH04185.1 hypothetical protein MEA186_31736 [Mesorhizobium amorphae CCNWGS0123]